METRRGDFIGKGQICQSNRNPDHAAGPPAQGRRRNGMYDSDCLHDRNFDFVFLREIERTGFRTYAAEIDRKPVDLQKQSNRLFKKNSGSKAKDFNTLVNGRGGGQKEMIQGSAECSEATLRKAMDSTFV